MKAKDFVKKHYPEAVAVKQRFVGIHERYTGYMINLSPQWEHYADARTEAKAWQEARENIEHDLKQGNNFKA